jgi:predicted acylesterase/phospholipase RssA
MNIVSFSGGGFKLIQHLAAYKALKEEFGELSVHNSKYAGVSSGAIAALICANQMHQEKWILDLATSRNLPKVVFGPWHKRPINSKGKLSVAAITRILLGYESIGDHTHLKTHLQKIVAKSKLPSHYRNAVMAVAVNPDSGERRIFRHDIDGILASCAIPIYMPPIKVGENKYFDGGIRDHSAAVTVLEKIPMRSNSIVFDIYSRPENPTRFLENYRHGITGHAKRLIDITTTEISYNDQNRVKEICNKFGYIHFQLFAPSILEGTFDTDPVRLQVAYHQTYSDIKKQIKNHPDINRVSQIIKSSV